MDKRLIVLVIIGIIPVVLLAYTAGFLTFEPQPPIPIREPDALLADSNSSQFEDFGFSFSYPSQIQISVVGIGDNAETAVLERGRVIGLFGEGADRVGVVITWTTPSGPRKEPLQLMAEALEYEIPGTGNLSEREIVSDRLVELPVRYTLLSRFSYTEDTADGQIEWFGFSAAWSDKASGRIFNILVLSTKQEPVRLYEEIALSFQTA